MSLAHTLILHHVLPLFASPLQLLTLKDLHVQPTITIDRNDRASLWLRSHQLELESLHDIPDLPLQWEQRTACCLAMSKHPQHGE